MSIADKLFDELDYTKSESDENDKYYANEYVDYSRDDFLITFDISAKLLVLSSEDYDIAILNTEELNAVFTKAKEVGWIE